MTEAIAGGLKRDGHQVQLVLDNLVAGTDAYVPWGLQSGHTITYVRLVVDGGLAVGAATVQLYVDGVAVTNGEITVLVNASAGQAFSVVPTANNVLSNDSIIRALVSGVNVTTSKATITLTVL